MTKLSETHSDNSGFGRRELFKLGAAGAATALVAAGCGTPGPAAADGLGPNEAAGFELNEISVSELQAGMENGRWSAETITGLYLERIEAIDKQGPTLRSVIEANPDALEIARGLDRERAQQGPRGPLHGIPVLLKDNIATSDRTTTTAGSLALEGSTPDADSFVARRLREAGAVLLGKANLSEWANFRSNQSSSGWSGRGRQCRNPYALDRNPCGSSAGSGVAVSASLTAVAIGTETNGSIVCPSSANGIVGIKPTVGLVSRSRIIPISATQDTAGPMGRTVRDAAILLGALTGEDPDDGATAGSGEHAQADYTAFLDAAGLQGARIGVSRGHFGFDSRVDGLMEGVLEVLRVGGAELIDPVENEGWKEAGRHSFQVMLYEFKDGLNRYLAQLGEGAPCKSLADVIAFNEANADREMPYFGQELLIQTEEKGPLTEADYGKALAEARRLSRDEGIDKVVAEHRLDAILGPTGGPAWVTDLVNGDLFSGGSSTPAAVAGYPNVTVPAGYIHGLPVGVSFFGPAFSEPVLIRIAYAFEQATSHRQAPRFLPTLELE